MQYLHATLALFGRQMRRYVPGDFLEGGRSAFDFDGVDTLSWDAARTTNKRKTTDFIALRMIYLAYG